MKSLHKTNPPVPLLWCPYLSILRPFFEPKKRPPPLFQKNYHKNLSFYEGWLPLEGVKRYQDWKFQSQNIYTNSFFFISWAPVGVCFHHGVYTKEHVDHIPSSCVPDCMCGARLHYAVSIIVGKMSSLCRVGRTSVVIVSLICYAPTIGSFVLVCQCASHHHHHRSYQFCHHNHPNHVLLIIITIILSPLCHKLWSSCHLLLWSPPKTQLKCPMRSSYNY